MNEKKLEKLKTYLMKLLNAANRWNTKGEDPPLLRVKYRDHLRFWGWGIGRAIERMEAGAYLVRLGWRVWEDPNWLLLWEGGANMEARAILKNCILEEKRLDTPELIQDLRWVLAGLLLVCGPTFDCLLKAEGGDLAK